ncbi:hypothetical protein F2Q69_00033337 [Brassica cretica]|uniref:Glycine cleavage system H protein n=1 Tax=Brassica cretica TaxID=69181 RepID=A0A8S9SPD3_BRACR|nr:hypothetical protein F2Q69_00033337 [Brassica cretica]
MLFIIKSSKVQIVMFSVPETLSSSTVAAILTTTAYSPSCSPCLYLSSSSSHSSPSSLRIREIPIASHHAFVEIVAPVFSRDAWRCVWHMIQDHLGDVVYVELPALGRSVSQGESFGAVESVKATSDINFAVSGTVVEVNEVLSESPGLVNTSPYEEGWIIKVELSDAGEVKKLMDSDKYSKFCEEENAKH